MSSYLNHYMSNLSSTRLKYNLDSSFSINHGLCKLLNQIVCVCIIFALSVSTGFSDEQLNNENSILKIEIVSETDDSITIDVTYTYNGEYGEKARLLAIAMIDREVKAEKPSVKLVTTGSKTERLKLIRPINTEGLIETKSIQASLYKLGNTFSFASKTVTHIKTWKDKTTLVKPGGVSQKQYHKDLLDNSIRLIDDSRLGGERLKIAKKNLEKIILEDPDNVRAYIELARVKIGEDTRVRGHNPTDGVYQAQRILGIAKEIDDTNPDVHILLGHTYTITGEFEKALELFAAAESLGTDNMWLYSNWGLTYQKQEDSKNAIKIYQKILDKPVKKYLSENRLSSHNRAIPFIYSRLISLLTISNDIEALERVYKHRMETLNEPCHLSDYGDFLLTIHGDHERAISLSERARKRGCGDDSSEVLARAYLTKLTKENKSSNSQLFYKSQALITNMAELIMRLSESEHTAPVITYLGNKGVEIDVMDVNKMTPLAYAVYYGDTESVETLLTLGADPNKKVTTNEITPAMLAVTTSDIDSLKLLIKNGADVKLRSKDGMTVLTIAQKLGNQKIIDLATKEFGT